MQGPIYTQVFIIADAGDPDAFKVFYPDFSGETAGSTDYLRRATFAEAAAPIPVTYVGDEQGFLPRLVYVPVQHELAYPYTAWDCEEVREQPSLKERLGFSSSEPRRFCEATIVATPKMRLI